jgi:hypothetical protein
MFAGENGWVAFAKTNLKIDNKRQLGLRDLIVTNNRNKTNSLP